MKYEDGDIIRYVEVELGNSYPSWYRDLDDEVEPGDWVIVPYQHQEREGIAAKVVKCVYPYVVFPAEKTKVILEITKKANSK